MVSKVLSNSDQASALKGRMDDWQKTLSSNCHDAIAYNTIVLAQILKHWSSVYEVPVSTLISLINGGTRDLCLGDLRDQLAKGLWDK